MKPCILFLLLLSAFITHAQKIEKFYDFNWKETDVSHARFLSVITPTDSGWHRMDYFINRKSLQMDGWFEDSACEIRTGKFTYVYPNKMIETTGYTLHDKKQGLWLTYHPNGMMADSTTYENDEPVGSSMGWYADGSIADSCFYNADGSGTEIRWFDNGNLSSAGMLSAGYKKTGKWKFFHKNGQPSSIELYNEGQLLQKQYFDESGAPLQDTTTRDRKADFPGGPTAWLKYLDKHLYFPSDYRITNSDAAAVVLTMDVDEDGKVSSAYISTPFFPPFEKIALDVILRSPKWLPAMDHNRRVRAVFNQPIIFSQPE